MFKIGRQQAIRIPKELRLAAKEVFVRRDPETRELILSPVPLDWDEIFAALDRAGIPDDFPTNRSSAQDFPRRRATALLAKR